MAKRFMNELLKYEEYLNKKTEKIQEYTRQLNEVEQAILSLEKQKGEIDDLETGIKKYREIETDIKEKSFMADILKRKIAKEQNNPALSDNDTKDIKEKARIYCCNAYKELSEYTTAAYGDIVNEIEKTLNEINTICSLVQNLTGDPNYQQHKICPDYFNHDLSATELKKDITRIKNNIGVINV